MYMSYCFFCDIISLFYFEIVYWEVGGVVYEIIFCIRVYMFIWGDDYLSEYGIFLMFLSKWKSVCSYFCLK